MVVYNTPTSSGGAALTPPASARNRDESEASQRSDASRESGRRSRASGESGRSTPHSRRAASAYERPAATTSEPLFSAGYFGLMSRLVVYLMMPLVPFSDNSPLDVSASIVVLFCPFFCRILSPFRCRSETRVPAERRQQQQQKRASFHELSILSFCDRFLPCQYVKRFWSS